MSEFHTDDKPGNSVLKKKIYMDYNATTPVAPEVVNAVTTSMIQRWGNPSSDHEFGSLAKQAVESAREDVARMISASPADIVFVSGGTEANNLVIYSAVVHFRKWMLSQSKSQMKPHIITTKVEHDSIKQPLKLRYFVEADVTYLGVEKLPEAVMDNIRPSTCLISVMLANNETGIMFSVAQIAKQLHEVNKKREAEGFSKIFLHTDAAQAIGKVPVDVTELNSDYLTIVGHKFYGPRIGALYCKNIRSKTPLYPLFYGGNQEGGHRSGTENTPMIVGLGMACSLVQQNIHVYNANMKKVRAYLERQLKKTFGNHVKINCVDPCNVVDPDACSIPPSGPKQQHFIFPRLPNTSSISFYYPEVTGLAILDQCEVLMASTGAACHSSSDSYSVLEASGVCSFHASKSIRLSIGRETTYDDVDYIVTDLRKATNKVINLADPLCINMK